MEYADATAVGLPILAGILWATCALQDLRLRRVSFLVLVAVAVLALLDRPWAWWAVVGAALVWPWRAQAWLLAPLAVGAGLVANDSAAAIALTVGATAWSLGWWGGADSVVLAAVALRHGIPGLIAASLTALCAGLALILARRRSLSGLIAALPSFLARQPADTEVPQAREMPAAAAMALGGLIMEGVVLCQTFG